MTAETIADPRTPAAPARNRGVNLEKWAWMYMRISGFALVILIFGHLLVNLVLGEGVRQIDFAFVAGKYATPFWQWWDVLMLWLAFIHGANGMRTVIADYVTHATARKTLTALVALAAAILIILGTLVVFTFDPCPAGAAKDLLPTFCPAS
ncbi:MAG TPA: succinate dehydrogenase hydrophobic membrane anchor subunit [Microbacterium sp.]|uniref:succinate dehydrogenase hydrophobic membrane anchor subunit n=1 Tax=Microbacterium sp. TaxID=51671 RepID=UPI002B47A59C|nr:succinate dehydrogenase hydrophobic membrane anchor subunit [Microbacterium sp.]HKT58095.1 succinate dehydrogenase hydrophobic membrane anchor subunit [Microbacterium sp.]